MTPGEWLLKRRLKRAKSDEEAFDLFFLFSSKRIHVRGKELPESFKLSRLREPWKTIAYAYQIWGEIGSDGLYQYLEDDEMVCFDPVLEAALRLLDLGGYEVISEYRRQSEENPRFWMREWHDHIFVDLPNTEPLLPPSEEAQEVWDAHRELFRRFWDETADFEQRAGAFLRAE